MCKALLARALVFALPCVATAQVAILQIKVVEGEGAVHTPGARLSRPIVVEVTEETGRPVAGAAVSFHVPDGGPGGMFPSGLRTEVLLSDNQGRVTLRSLQLNRTPGPFQIRITAVKDQARAGTVSQQYVAELRTVSAKPVKTGGMSGKKWFVVAAVASAAAGGVVAGVARGGSGSAPKPAPPPLLSIGVPAITVGRQ